ncbi:hypothetical protein ETR_03844, partial [Erwinia tracheiphila PSU-1]
MKGIKIMWVNNLGAFVGRAVPILGWAILAHDVTMIGFRTMNTYNSMVRPEGRDA